MKIKNFISFLIVSLTVFVVSCPRVPVVDFGGLGSGGDKVPLSRHILTGYLPNGLRYFILENSLPENRAQVALVVNAGSVLERDDEQGFAHFVEHMAFKGTARFPEMELIDYLRSLGVRFGPDANAFVSYNETVFHFDVPTEIIDGVRRIPDKALAILDDWTHQINFYPEDVDSERRVVLEEIRARAGAMERVRRITLPILFENSPFVNRHPLGLAELIEEATPEQLRAFYDRWYTADNMALVFIGDFDAQVLQAELAQHFNMPAPVQPVNRPRYELPPPRSENFHVEIITDPELSFTSFSIYFKQDQRPPRGTLAYYRQSIIDHLIAAMLSLRFEEAATDPDSAFTSAWGGIWRWASASSFYILDVQPKTGYVEQALSELLLEKESMRRFGFTQSELDRAKLNLVSFMEQQLSEKDRMESRTFFRSLLNHFLFGNAMPDIEWEAKAVNALLPGISLNDITQSAANYFAPNDIRLFLIAPESEAENLPTADRIREIFRESAGARLSPRQDTAAADGLLENVPVPGVILSQERDETGAYILTLENGARVILKETTNRNNEIIFHAMAEGGTANATEETIVSVSLLSDMLNVSGLGPFSRTELINQLAGKQVSFSFWTANFNRGFQGTSTIADLTTLFEMIHIFFTNPRFDERAIAAMIDQYRTNLLHQNENPQNVFSQELSRLINGNHPLFRPLEFDDMDRVSIEQARNFLNLCLNPGDYTFVFTGNLDLQTIRDLSAYYIASIPPSSSMNSWTNPGITRPAPGRRTIFRGVDDRCTVFIGWFAQGSPNFSEQRNQVAAVLSEYLDILLMDEIRENLGGVYSISSWASVSVIPTGEYRISVHFVCDPERVEELIAASKENIAGIANRPLNMERFNQAREALLLGHERSIQRNLHIAQSFVNSAVLFNTPLNRLHQRPDVIRAVTPQDVQALARQILANSPVEFVMFPQFNLQEAP